MPSLFLAIGFIPTFCSGQQVFNQTQNAIIVQPSLTKPGGPPFHLKATITDKDDPENPISVEMFWVTPSKWRREIKSQDFSQTVIANGQVIYDEHSDDYMPLAIETLVMAMIDPTPLLASLGPQDLALTKANGAAEETGVVCFGASQRMPTSLCQKTPSGLREIIGPAGHPVQFTDYQSFGRARVARVLITTPEVGTAYTAKVTELSRLKHADEKLFVPPSVTPTHAQLRTAVFTEEELRGLSPQPREIIWPQVLDGNTTGQAAYYLSIDPSGQVRETVVVRSDNERANDSARRQIMRWKFSPPVRDGVPVQAEGILHFTLNTRAWGPRTPLTNLEVRRLAESVVEPEFPPAAAASGSVCTVMVAIDNEGKLIEAIAGGGAPGLSRYTMDAVRKWRFSPIIEDGEPRPYRAQIDFRVP